MDPADDLTTLDDNALIDLLAHSSKEALSAAAGELYNRYGRLVFSVALRVVGDSETAEEITQDVFVKAWEASSAYRPETAKLSSWLASISRHRAIDELRRRAVRPVQDRSEWLDDSELESESALRAPDDTEKTVETAWQGRNIRRIVTALPQEQRQVLGLAYYQGLSHSQMAGLLNQPLGTVKGRLRLALQKVRDSLIREKIIET